MTITEIQLPASGALAAQLCLAAGLPASAAGQVRAAAIRAAAYADELVQCGQSVLDASQSVGWTGAAAEAFTQRLASGAPNLQATADRFDAYASALLGYARSLDDLGQQISSARADLAAQFARPAPANSLGIITSLTIITHPAQLAQQAQLAKQQDDELLRLAQRFSWLYNQWVQAVRACIAGIKSADRADPTHDLHGWALWEHTAASYVSPVADFWEHPSWTNASHALAWLGSNLSFIAIAMMPLSPQLAAVVFIAASAVSAIQLGVDAWRKFHLHDPSVSDEDLIMDGVGALPVSGIAEGAEKVGKAAEEGWAAADVAGTNRLGGLVSKAAGKTVDVVKDAARDPQEFYSPGLDSLAKDYFRSGPPKELAKRWASTALWDAPNAVLGLPNMGGTSLPQALYPKAKAATKEVDTKLEDVASKVEDAVEPQP
jgi:uncharacterized protein YukE